MTTGIYVPAGRALEYSAYACNLYTGCTHGCTYCYARKMAYRFGRKSEWDNPKPRDGIMKALEKDGSKLMAQGIVASVLLCFTCDPYGDLADGHSFLTRSALELLRSYNQNFTILTKAGQIACRDFELYREGDKFGATLTLHTGWKKYEPNAAPYQERVENLREAHRRCISTFVSMEPLLDTQQALEIIESTAEYVDFYKLGTLNHAGKKDGKALGKYLSDAETLLRKLGRQWVVKIEKRKKNKV